MKIGELAALTGASPKAIRRYEALGLVAPARRANGYREYDDRDVRAVQEIRGLNRLGIPVEDTRPFLDCLADGSPNADDCPASLAEYRRAIADLTAQIDNLTARRETLTRRLRAAAYRTTPPPLPGTHAAARTHPIPTARSTDISAISTPPRTTADSAAQPGRAADERTPPVDFPIPLPAQAALCTLSPGLPLPVDDGAADHLPGMRLPSLSHTATDGTLIDLAALGPGRTVLYLYPLTGRPDTDLPVGWNEIPGARGCTAQACGFRDHHSDLLAAGANRVFGLSSQDSAYQREVTERLRLPFAMLSDPGLRLADALDLPTFTAGADRLYRRLTMIVRDGGIEHVFYPVFAPDRHADEVLDWLRVHPLS
ncbi:redoxin family protein [Nocardia inohanensis]|uniref:redoxin family protein n=1 Tax=Nocardia inohanensis TaxID=209246 RepID=UPI000837836B